LAGRIRLVRRFLLAAPWAPAANTMPPPQESSLFPRPATGIRLPHPHVSSFFSSFWRSGFPRPPTGPAFLRRGIPSCHRLLKLAVPALVLCPPPCGPPPPPPSAFVTSCRARPWCPSFCRLLDPLPLAGPALAAPWFLCWPSLLRPASPPPAYGPAPPLWPLPPAAPPPLLVSPLVFCRLLPFSRPRITIPPSFPGPTFWLVVPSGGSVVWALVWPPPAHFRRRVGRFSVVQFMVRAPRPGCCCFLVAGLLTSSCPGPLTAGALAPWAEILFAQ